MNLRVKILLKISNFVSRMEIETAATTIRIERALDQRKGQIEDLKAINALIGQQLYQLENIPIKFIKMATIDFTGNLKWTIIGLQEYLRSS